jgi:hypothetical protein
LSEEEQSDDSSSSSSSSSSDDDDDDNRPIRECEGVMPLPQQINVGSTIYTKGVTYTFLQDKRNYRDKDLYKRKNDIFVEGVVKKVDLEMGRVSAVFPSINKRSIYLSTNWFDNHWVQNLPNNAHILKKDDYMCYDDTDDDDDDDDDNNNNRNNDNNNDDNYNDNDADPEEEENSNHKKKKANLSKDVVLRNAEGLLGRRGGGRGRGEGGRGEGGRRGGGRGRGEGGGGGRRGRRRGGGGEGTTGGRRRN